MGVGFHITRRERWSDDGNDITLQEWRDYTETDPEFVLEYEFPLSDGRVEIVKNDGYAYWTAYSDPDVDHVPLGWFNGYISINNADEEIIAKMYRIAEALGGNVQDDAGCRYDSHGQFIPPTPNPNISNDIQDYLNFRESQTLDQNNRKPWWKFW